MHVGRRSHRERDVLLVPVLPGTALEGAVVPPPPEARRRRPLLLLALGLVVVAAIATGVVLLARGPGKARRTTVATPSVATPTVQAPVPVTPKPKPAGPTPAERAHAAAVRLASRLPVALESAALLRTGSTVYVVGGSRDGTPVDGVWRIDLAHGRVSQAGRFIEPLADAASAQRGGVLYVAGGWTGAQGATAVLRWTPGSGPTLVTRLPASVRGARAAFVGGKLYVVGGSPRVAVVVDVDAGSVSAAAAVPAALRGGGSKPNLALLQRALLAVRG